MAKCNEKIAAIAGVNAGLIAELLLNVKSRGLERIVYKDGKIYVRCSMKTMNIYMNFLSVNQIKNAVKKLRENNIVTVKKLNVSRYDHTYYYAFTDYGERLMREKLNEKGMQEMRI